MKSNLDKFFKTDADLENNGMWFDISETTGFRVRAFKASNPRAKAAMAAHYKPYARQIEIGALEVTKQREVTTKLFIEMCLVEWRGVQIDDKDVELTTENALKLFTALPDLFDTLWRHANDFTNYKEELGNS